MPLPGTRPLGCVVNLEDNTSLPRPSNYRCVWELSIHVTSRASSFSRIRCNASRPSSSCSARSGSSSRSSSSVEPSRLCTVTWTKPGEVRFWEKCSALGLQTPSKKVFNLLKTPQNTFLEGMDGALVVH